MNSTKVFVLSAGNSTMSRLRVTLKLIYKKRYAYLFISPFFILFSIFLLYPTLRSIYLSFHKWEGFGTYSYVGIENYVNLLGDPLFRKSIFNSIYIMVLSNVPQWVLAVAIAVTLNSRLIRFRGIWRSIYFSPIILSAVVVSMVFLLIFDTQYGFLNYLIGLAGGAPIGWITTQEMSKVSVSLLAVWRWTGWNMVIVLAGLQSIPIELYDAAKVDGAESWALFRHITLPLLRPVLIFIFMLSTIDGLRLFAEPALLTKGGPAQSSLTMVMYLYRQAFEFRNFGYASAIAVAIFVFVAVISTVAWRFITNENE
jgi:ABC-type sugar transport system permease subunit